MAGVFVFVQIYRHCFQLTGDIIKAIYLKGGVDLKKRALILALVTVMVFAFAGMSFANVYYYDSSGLNGTINNIGNYNYLNFSNGLSGANTNIGGYDYTNYNNGLNSVGYGIGNTYYANFNNGLNATVNNIGGYDYYNYSDGTSGNGVWIGNYYYYNGY